MSSRNKQKLGPLRLNWLVTKMPLRKNFGSTNASESLSKKTIDNQIGLNISNEPT